MSNYAVPNTAIDFGDAPSGRPPTEAEKEQIRTVLDLYTRSDIETLVADEVAAVTAYVHSQPSASATWLINHNQGYRPSVEVFSIGWVEVDAEVVHLNENSLEVRFASAQNGFARLT